MTVSTKDVEDKVDSLGSTGMMNNQDMQSQTWSGNFVLATALLAMTQRLDRVIELLEEQASQSK